MPGLRDKLKKRSRVQGLCEMGVIVKDACVAAIAPSLLLVSLPRQALPTEWWESGHFLLADVGIDKSI